MKNPEISHGQNEGLNLIPKTENWLGFPVLCTGKFLLESSEMRRAGDIKFLSVVRFMGMLRVCCYPKISFGPCWKPALKEDNLLEGNQGEVYTDAPNTPQ